MHTETVSYDLITIKFSELEGRSLVAKERIRQGKTILRLEGKTQPEPDMYSIEIMPGTHLDCYASPIGATNHSCKPNAYISFKGGELRLVAWACIEPGEEITIDYRKTESHLSSPFTCHCCGERMEW